MKDWRIRYGAIVCYYGATPVFFVIDYYFGSSIRLAALDSYPQLKFLYYGICTFSACWMLKSRFWAKVFAPIETSTNILLLILGMLTPYFRAIEAAQRGQVVAGLTTEWVLNFMLAAGAAAFAFYGIGVKRME